MLELSTISGVDESVKTSHFSWKPEKQKRQLKESQIIDVDDDFEAFRADNFDFVWNVTEHNENSISL